MQKPLQSVCFPDKGERLRLLQVEDSEADAELLVDELIEDGLQVEARLVDNEVDYIAALGEFEPHIVLSDLSMPGFDGHRALTLLREQHPYLPFIFVSGTIGEDAAIEALRNGATDYILKHNITRLASAVRRALREAGEQQAREHAEAELINAQRFESLALLAGGLSHDLRNLLQPLLLAADTLDDYRDDERLRRLGDMIRDCGQRGLDMVTSMLTFARGSQRAERVRLGDLLGALLLLLQGTVPRTVELDIDTSADALEFEGNHTELQQCLLNLCLNAIQAMPEGGRLQLTTNEEELDEGFFRDSPGAGAGRYLRISVCDTGVGMGPEVLGRLFQPFFTTKSDGTGLGLLSCKRIVAGHDGVLRVQSTQGEGTTFHIYLPLTRPQTGRAPTEELPYGNGESTLVVVEEAAQLSLLSDTLDTYGYRTQTCQSGAAALQHIESGGLPDLVVLDADMNLMTGVRTLAALLERDYGGAVLLLANVRHVENLEGLPPLPHLRVLHKPVEVGALLRAVRESLGEVRSGSEVAQAHDGT